MPNTQPQNKAHNTSSTNSTTVTAACLLVYSAFVHLDNAIKKLPRVYSQQNGELFMKPGSIF